MKQPKRRSMLRRIFGEIFYRVKKFFRWHFSKINFAKDLRRKLLKKKIFAHKTPLMRKLKGVDMKYQKNKITNLRIAVKHLDGLVILPGQSFSYWRQIGNPTKNKGYLDGMILRGGKVDYGIGGGLCQLSNLIFWMTLHTPLTIVERWRHGYDVFPDVSRKLPFGSGATCSYPSIDLEIKNETDRPFQLVLSVGKKFLNGEWRSDRELDERYEVVEKNHRIKHEIWGGYTRNNEIFRKVFDRRGKLLREEFITGNHAIMMYSPLLS